MSYLFTSESVSEGHPDKIADQISDSVLDAYLTLDPMSKVACEVLVTTGLVVLGGEVKSIAKVNEPEVAREIIRKIGYTKAEYMFDADSCGIISAIHEQSADIRQGVEQENKEIGAGDQGLMFGYATNETEAYIPLPIMIAHELLKELAVIRREGKVMKYLRPDAKSQVTIEYDEETHKAIKIDTIVISTQHDEFGGDKKMQDTIKKDVKTILIPRVMKKMKKEHQKLFGTTIRYLVNPTGRFVIGGPHGDTGLTGRKIIVDTYGGKVSHGGGAFSGKDPTKVDRSAAYATRHMAKNIVAAGVADEAIVQVAYAIGVAEPVSIYVNTFGTAKVKSNKGEILTDVEITKKLQDIFDMRPRAIIERFKLRNPIYADTAKYGHFGKKPFTKKLDLVRGGKSVKQEIEFYTWEKLDHVEKIKKVFGK